MVHALIVDDTVGYASTVPIEDHLVVFFPFGHPPTFPPPSSSLTSPFLTPIPLSFLPIPLSVFEPVPPLYLFPLSMPSLPLLLLFATPSFFIFPSLLCSLTNPSFSHPSHPFFLSPLSTPLSLAGPLTSVKLCWEGLRILYLIESL
jgi:hypothetical protein